MTIDLPSKVQLYGWRPSGVLNRGSTPQCTKISSCTCASCSRTFAVSRWPFVFRFSNFIQLLNLKYDETKMTRHHCSFVESTFIVCTTWVRTINKVYTRTGRGVGRFRPTHAPPDALRHKSPNRSAEEKPWRSTPTSPGMCGWASRSQRL